MSGDATYFEEPVGMSFYSTAISPSLDVLPFNENSLNCALASETSQPNFQCSLENTDVKPCVNEYIIGDILKQPDEAPGTLSSQLFPANIKKELISESEFNIHSLSANVEQSLQVKSETNQKISNSQTASSSVPESTRLCFTPSVAPLSSTYNPAAFYESTLPIAIPSTTICINISPASSLSRKKVNLDQSLPSATCIYNIRPQTIVKATPVTLQKCKICGILVPLTNYYEHKKTHDNETILDCDLCGELFAHQNVLNFHMKSHFGEKRFYRNSTKNGNFNNQTELETKQQSRVNRKISDTSENSVLTNPSLSQSTEKISSLMLSNAVLEAALKEKNLSHQPQMFQQNIYSMTESNDEIVGESNFKQNSSTHFTAEDLNENLKIQDSKNCSSLVKSTPKTFTPSYFDTKGKSTSPKQNNEHSIEDETTIENGTGTIENCASTGNSSVASITEKDFNLDFDKPHTSSCISGTKRLVIDQAVNNCTSFEIENRLNFENTTEDDQLQNSALCKLINTSNEDAILPCDTLPLNVNITQTLDHIGSGFGTKDVSISKEHSESADQEGDDLKPHSKISTNSKIYKCDECGKTFRSGQTLNEHQKGHTRDRQHKCDVCGSLFRDKSTLNLHHFKHAAGKVYSCKICKQRFRNEVSLKKHARFHKREKYDDLSLLDTMVVSQEPQSENKSLARKEFDSISVPQASSVDIEMPSTHPSTKMADILCPLQSIRIERIPKSDNCFLSKSASSSCSKYNLESDTSSSTKNQGPLSRGEEQYGLQIKNSEPYASLNILEMSEKEQSTHLKNKDKSKSTTAEVLQGKSKEIDPLTILANFSRLTTSKMTFVEESTTAGGKSSQPICFPEAKCSGGSESGPKLAFPKEFSEARCVPVWQETLEHTLSLQEEISQPKKCFITETFDPLISRIGKDVPTLPILTTEEFTKLPVVKITPSKETIIPQSSSIITNIVSEKQATSVLDIPCQAKSSNFVKHALGTGPSIPNSPFSNVIFESHSDSRMNQMHCEHTNSENEVSNTELPLNNSTAISIQRSEKVLTTKAKGKSKCQDAKESLPSDIPDSVTLEYLMGSISDIDRPLRCKLCFHTFRSAFHLKSHTKRIHKPAVKTKKKMKKGQNREVERKRPFKCAECGKAFYTRHILNGHMKSHSGVKPHKCDLCSVSYRHKSSLIVHKRRHAGEKPFACDQCNYRGYSKPALAQHKTKHTDKRPYHCDVCGFKFRMPHHLKSHKMIHTGEKPYLCDVCGFSCRQLGAYQQHKKSHGLQSILTCKACSQAFKNQRELVSHVSTSHPLDVSDLLLEIETKVAIKKRPSRCGKKYDCDVCGLKCGNFAHFKVHQMRHNGIKPFKCQFCDYASTLKTQLQQHEHIHTGVKPFQCDTCGKTFRLKNHLKQHLLIHTGERPHVCEFCNKSFRQLAALLLHKTIHTQEKPFSCDDCGEAFRLKNELRKHSITHAVAKPLKCDLCPSIFRLRQHLQQHMRTHTAVERSYKCDICNSTYRQISHLRQHQKSHTAEKSFKCDECPSAFRTRSNLKRHQLGHVKKKQGGNYNSERIFVDTPVTNNSIESYPGSLSTTAENEERDDLISSTTNPSIYLAKVVYFDENEEDPDWTTPELESQITLLERTMELRGSKNKKVVIGGEESMESETQEIESVLLSTLGISPCAVKVRRMD